MADREENVYLAKLAEQAERYDEMVQAMKRVAVLNVELSVEERNLFSVAYKNVIGARRGCWRTVCNIEQKHALKGFQACQLPLIQQYRRNIEKELQSICVDILEVLDTHLIPVASNTDSKVFFHKMKGDYYRYLAECSVEGSRKSAAEHSLEAYKAASAVAVNGLPPSHPVRLGLALNLSVFYYEILGSQECACSIARQAFDDAVTDLGSARNETYKESTLIMQLLRDNIKLWS